MKTIDPTRATLTQLRTLPQGRPVVMLNLLRYREAAIYPTEEACEPCAGREAYRRYSKVAIKTVAAVGGEVVWAGAAMVGVIAPPDEHWDDVLLVRYPSVAAFLDMLGMPDYQAAAVHRAAALEDSRLIATMQPD